MSDLKDNKPGLKQTKPFALNILILIYIIYGFFLTLGSHSGFPTAMRTGSWMPYLADKPVGEDAYYMLTVAWNLSEGKGLVYNDNKITTGFQPLGTFVYACFSRIVKWLGGDKWIFCRLVLLLGVFLLLLFAQIIGKTAYDFFPPTDPTRNTAYIVAFLAAIFNFSLFRLFTYGLETGIYLTLIALCVRWTLKHHNTVDWKFPQAIFFGLLVGLATLARIDFVIIILIFVSICLLKRHMKLLLAMAAGFSTILVISPWFIWVKSVSGQWMPSSGTAQAALISAKNAEPRITNMIISIVDHLTPWAFEANRKTLVLFGLISLVAFILWVKRKKGFHFIPPSHSSKKTLLVFWTAGMCFLVCIYIVFFWPLHFYLRYSAVILAVLIPVLAASTAKRMASVSRRMRIAALFLLPVCFFAAAFVSLHTGRIGNNLTIAAGFIKKEFPPPARVGSFQSGVIGYFNSNVINLDGKVNSDAMRFIQRGDIANYINRERIKVLVDWPGYINTRLSNDYLATKWKLYPKIILADEIVSYIRK